MLNPTDTHAAVDGNADGRTAEQMLEELQLLARERPAELLSIASEFAQRDVEHPSDALYNAVLEGVEVQKLEELLDAQVVFAGALVDAVDIAWRHPNNEQFTALHIAADTGNVGALSLLARRGADIGSRDARGRTPLHVSVGSLACTRELVLLGSALDTVDRTGATPLHVAAGEGNIAVLHMLLSVGASVTAEDLRGRTALHCAAQAGDAECLLELLHGGSDVEAKDADGRSAQVRRAPKQQQQRSDNLPCLHAQCVCARARARVCCSCSCSCFLAPP